MLSRQRIVVVLIFVLGCLAVGPRPCQGQILVTDSGNGFTISFNGLDLLEHDQSGEPLFSLGKGEFEAVYDLGNYDINDTVTEKYALDQYDFGENNTLSKITATQAVQIANCRPSKHANPHYITWPTTAESHEMFGLASATWS